MPLIYRRFIARIGALLLLCFASGCASGGKADADDTRTVRVLPPDDSPPPSADGMPAGFGAAFTAADTRARAVLYYQQCSANVVRLRAAGTFGAPRTAPRTVYCERNADGLPLGGVFDIDTGYTKARRLIMIRLDGTRPRYTGAIDTARVAQGARLVRDVTREIASAARRQGRTYFVAPVVQADGTLEGWAIPQTTRGARTAVIGGDMAFVRESGAALRKVVDRGATWKLIALPSAGAVRLASAERDVAAVTELALARTLAERGRDVMVTTAVATSALVAGRDASGSRYRWEHQRVTP